MFLKVYLVMVILSQCIFPSEWTFQDYQHMHIMRKLLVYAKHSAQAPEYGCFPTIYEIMSDREKERF